MKLYIASSWRNQYYPETVERLRAAGFDVYDFRNPPTGHGFKWSMVSEDYMDWTPAEYRGQLNSNPLAQRQLRNDVEAMESCDACVLVLPCGRSAHTEAGWFAGRGKKVVAYLPEKVEPELMYGLFTDVCDTLEGVIEVLRDMPRSTLTPSQESTPTPQLIEIHDIEKQNGHPSIKGMQAICDQFIEAIK